MPLINLSLEHGRNLDEAQATLVSVVDQLRAKFGILVRQVEWSTNRQAVKISGVGFVIEMRVDAKQVHVSGDLPALGGLLSGPLAAGLKRIVRSSFQKHLPGHQ
jgi:uncharacterized protein YlxP (DUF503 family)